MYSKIKIIHFCSGFNKPEIVCAAALGIEHANQIPDSAIVASSRYNTYYGPERARLRLVTEGSFIGGWSPRSSNTGEWIQFDLAQNTKVTGIATQGRESADRWVTSYSLSFRVNGGSYESYNNGYVSNISICIWYKFTVVYCESVNSIGYITVFYLLKENSYASVHIAHHV